ncbi:MAG: hypothetical protein KC731_17865, partial [Myxococcales bacterium]|nr:hypothetical protein [Myxococcales bacterium]
MTSCSFDRLLGLALVTSLAACAVDAPAPDAAALDARRRLIRASLDVRGIRPSLEELDQVKSDPDAVDGLVEGFVDHPGFARRVRAIFAPALRTRRDEISIEGEAFGLDAEDEGRFAEAVTEEALNLIADVAVADRPFTEILTA